MRGAGANESLAKGTAALLNVELTLARLSDDPNKKYKIIDILERAPDALTRQKLKEQYAAANGGASIEQMLAVEPGLDARAKQQSLDLLSARRDLATDTLAAMDPKQREDLEGRAAGYADKILAVTRASDNDDSAHADKVADVLAGRTPEEMEVIRARVRLQTSGTRRATLYEELDRSFTQRDKGIAMAGLHGNHAAVAAEQLADAAAEKDPARIHKVVKQLGTDGLAELRATHPELSDNVISQMPADQRAHVQAAMDGKTGEADGARIASLLQPVTFEAGDIWNTDKTKQKLSTKDAQNPERLIAELGKMSPAELAEARKTHGAEWDKRIAERFKDADSTVRLRIEAAARGDRVDEKALRLRQGMRTFDQKLIDQALANPDLKSSDPKKRTAAEAERAQLQARVRQYDANEQLTQAIVSGNGAGRTFAGRSMEDQLSAHYARAKEHDTARPSSVFDAATHEVKKDERKAKIREKATVDEFAAKEMWAEGDARASTKVRRAELAGDAGRKAEILEGLDSKTKDDSGDTLDAQSAEYQRKFRREMLARPDYTDAEAAVEHLGWLVGGEGSKEERAKQLTRENMTVGEMRVEHVRESGVLADRSKETRLAQQKELRDLSHSGYLEGNEQWRHAMGGNRGAEDLLQSSIDVMEAGIADGVSDREFARRDRSASGALELQRAEKQKAAAEVAQMFSIAAKIAALATANPWMFAAVDAAFGLAGVAAQELIANEAYDATNGLKHVGVDAMTDLAGGALGKFAKGNKWLDMAGNAGLAVAGSEMHAAIDGQEGGGGVVRNALGAVLPGVFRGKTEGLIEGTGKLANIGRGALGTASDVVTNVGLSGGHMDGMSAFDAVTNTAQGRLHGGHRPKAQHHEHAAMARHLATHDIDVARRSAPHDDLLRRAPTTEHADPKLAGLDDHHRAMEAKKAADAISVHAYVVDHDGPSYAATSPLYAGEAPAHHGAASQSPHAATSGGNSGGSEPLALASTPPSNAPPPPRDDSPPSSSPPPPRAQNDHDALMDLAVNHAKTPEHKEQIVDWGEELDVREGFVPHREVLREMHGVARADSPYPSKEHGAILREWGHEGQLDRLPLVDALHHEGISPIDTQRVFDKAVKNDASASLKPEDPGIHTASDGTPLVKPLSDHPDALTQDDITFLADVHGRRSDHLHGPYTTSAGRELPGSPMRKVVPDAAAHDYRTGVRIDRNTGQPVPADSVGGYVGARSTTEGKSADQAMGTLGMDYVDSPYVDKSGTQVSPNVQKNGASAAEWNMTAEQDARRKVPFGDDATGHIQDHRRHLEEVGAHIPTLYEGDHRLDTNNRTSQNDPGTGWGFSASERLLDSDGRPHRPEPNQEMTLKYTKLPPYDVVHLPSEAQTERNEAAKDLFKRADAAKKSKSVDPSLSTDIPGVLEAARHARTSDVDPARQAKREEFEGALANHPKVHELVGPTLDMMSNKLLDYLGVMHPGEIDDKLALLGQAPSQRGYAGAVGTDPLVIREALKGGNIRERMVLLSEFQEQILGNDALKEGGIDRMRERFGGEHQGAFSIADVERLAAVHKRYIDSLPEGAERDPKATSSKALFDVNRLDNEHADYANAKSEGGDTKLPQFTPEAASAQLGRLIASPTPAGEASPFARTQLTIEEANARGMALSPREMAFAEAKGGPHLPWVVGSQANIVNPEAPFIRGARDNALPLKAGISGTTFRGMRLAEVMGADSEKARLALFSQLNGVEAHSMHEIASAANGYFGGNSSSRYDVHTPYTEGSTGIDTDTLRAVAESLDISLEELNLFVGNDRKTK